MWKNDARNPPPRERQTQPSLCSHGDLPGLVGKQWLCCDKCCSLGRMRNTLQLAGEFVRHIT